MTNDLPIPAPEPRSPSRRREFLARIREEWRKSQQEQSFAAMLARKSRIFFPREEVGRKVGSFPENPYAIGIGGFPLRWEEWEAGTGGWPFPLFYSLSGSGPPGRRRIPNAEPDMIPSERNTL
jgi:hypothetical protein